MSHNSKIMENENELENSENLQEGGEPSEKAPDQTLKIKELEEKNKQLFERAKKAETEAKELKSKYLKEEPKEEPKGVNYNDPKSSIRLLKALEGYSEDELEIIYDVAGKDATSEDLINASKKEWVKTAITAKREKVAKEKQIPEPSTLSGSQQVKGLTLDEITKDPGAHKKAWEDFMKKGKVQGMGI